MVTGEMYNTCNAAKSVKKKRGAEWPREPEYIKEIW